ncbi:MAG: V-type ATPase subunit, partial [Oscillospiraceae bacterium]|nr:V-type ATPase subunit [Oscillospiraceae bacterium]
YHKARFEICKRCMYFAVAPAATVLAFYFLLENEIVNIIHIVEAARYGFDRRMLDQLLIY